MDAPASPRSRRSLLTAVAAAGGALVTDALVRPTPVAAADVVLGAVNTAAAATTIRTTEASAGAKAIVGLVTTTIAGPATAGVLGQSNAVDGSGIFGYAPTGPTAKGVWGRAANGIGVFGEALATSGENYGVLGTTASTSGGRGLSGRATATTGTNYGVRGTSASTGGFGVYGRATATTGDTYGVYGRSDSSRGAGVSGYAPRIGIRAVGGLYGVHSTANGYGIWAESTLNTGVVGYATSDESGSVGVRGESRARHGRGVVALGAGGGVSYGIYAASNSGSGYGGYFFNNVHVEGHFTKSSGSFLIDHPLDPANRTLEHSFVEAPQMLNVYSGSVTLDARGTATVRLPRYFRSLNTEYRYQLTPVGAPAPNLHVAREVTRNSFRIAGGVTGQKVCWIVTGVRQDAWAQKHPLRVERTKKRKDRGKYLNPELFGKPKSASMHPVPKLPRRPRRLPRPKAA